MSDKTMRYSIVANERHLQLKCKIRSMKTETERMITAVREYVREDDQKITIEMPAVKK